MSAENVGMIRKASEAFAESDLVTLAASLEEDDNRRWWMCKRWRTDGFARTR